MEELKFNVINAGALMAGMFLTQVESVLSILVLATALIYNVVKLYRQRKDR